MAIEMTALRRILAPTLALLGMASAPLAASAQTVPVSLRDSVPIGSNGLCEAQIQSPRPDEGLFDRRYLIVCRDAAASVGTLYVLGDASLDTALTMATGDGAQCRDAGAGAVPAGMLEAHSYICTRPGNPIERTVTVGRSGSRVFAANGLTVYDDALRLGLATLATDRPVEGNVEVPLTLAGDAQAFARAQAETISAENALDEAYRRSNAGNFAEAAEFFSVSATGMQGRSSTEAMLNEAMQQSNLANFEQAGALFQAAAPAAQNDPVLVRLARNFQAADALNRDQPAQALEIVDTPLPALTENSDATLQLQIDDALAERLSAEQGNAISGVASDLTLLERVDLLDGQTLYLRGTALRQLGQVETAQGELQAAQDKLVSVRGGRVVSILWLRAQILADLADIQERRGNLAGAEALHTEAVSVLENNYPGSPALISARAQLAGLLARSGRDAEAITLYRMLVAETQTTPPASLRRLFGPYFRLLSEREGDAQSAADMFAASQLLIRPGLAQTQAVLARELSAGSDEAAQLFRQAVNLGRSLEVLRGNVAQMQQQVDNQVEGADVRLAQLTGELAQLQQRQLEVQQQLALYPRYRAVSDERISLSGLQATLRAGEAYLKLVMLGNAAYAIYAQPDSATAYKLGASPDAIDRMVNTLRDSIAIEEAGQTITYPFDLDTARTLYSALMGPIAPNLASITHLVFEPDGPMLRLPINLLVTDDASVSTYAARTADPAADPYDYRGIAWLGRTVQITTAVSPSAFRDVRSARRSDASGEYLGLGQNLPLTQAAVQTGGTRSAQFGARCSWSPLTWDNPIRADELRTAGNILQTDGAGVEILTGGEFTDTHLKAMTNLDEFRILHFATHGLVTSPETDCPPRPALLTSFGDADSDGLLSFAEIYDLHLDADLVILSACNTAGVGGLAASREAGVTTGGDFALDGLVRAFVGAGGRTVVASHWPVPDDYNATDRLITGFFENGKNASTAAAMQLSELALMDDAETSHPFYWAAFAVVGDGAVDVRH